jgi:pimeloyl-ACP methyl ester carboxylesterase
MPIEVSLASGLVLRGLEYSQDGPPILLVHDLGGDADSWSQIPQVLVAKGFQVITLELRGHGLSDGEADPATTHGDLKEALSMICGAFGPVALVSYGSTATECLRLGPDDGAPVQVLISPISTHDFDPGDSIPAMRAIFAGTKDDEADSFIRSIYPKLKGQNMWFSSGISDQGVDLLISRTHMVEQVVMFVRRYLVGHHLAWIAQHQADDPRTEDEQHENEERAPNELGLGSQYRK